MEVELEEIELGLKKRVKNPNFSAANRSRLRSCLDRNTGPKMDRFFLENFGHDFGPAWTETMTEVWQISLTLDPFETL